MGVGHCKALKQLFGHKGVQIFAAGDLYHSAQDVCVVSVNVFLSRMLVEGQGGHPLDGLQNRLSSVSKVPSLKTRLLPLIPRRTAAIADSASVGEQVANGDGSPGVFQTIAAVRFADSNFHVFPFWDVATQRVAYIKLAALMEYHDAGTHQCFCLRGDPENGILTHGDPR